MHSSRGALQKKLLAVNEIILNLFGILSLVNLVIKSFAFDMVCLELPSGANNFARYLAISYVAVAILETIDLKISLSTPSLSLSL